MVEKYITDVADMIYHYLKNEDLNAIERKILPYLENQRTKKLNLVKTPILNAIGKELGKRLEREAWAFDRLFRLWKISFFNAKKLEFGVTSGRELRYIIINAVGWLSKKNYEQSKKFVLKIIDDLKDWEMVDSLALRVMINLTKENKTEIFSLLEKWTHHENKWIHRLTAATIPSYIRTKPNEANDCLNILQRLMTDEDQDVKKAVAWALREITKKDPKAVFNFLLSYLPTINRHTRWIVKEGSKKLPTEWRRSVLDKLVE